MDFQAYGVIAGFFTLTGILLGFIGWTFRKRMGKNKSSVQKEFSSKDKDIPTFNASLILYGMLFVVFSLSLLFLFPWALSFGMVGIKGFLAVLLLLGFLGVGFFYSWKKETLERS